VRVIALVEDLPIEYPVIEGVEMRPTWRFGSISTPVRLARCRAPRPVQTSCCSTRTFTSFALAKVRGAGSHDARWPSALARLPVITLMHNIVETVDLSAAGFSRPAPCRSSCCVRLARA
jgi:hypothetical protein